MMRKIADPDRWPTRCSTAAMAHYRLRYLDPSGKFIRADRVDCDSDPDAIDIAYHRHLPVRSELWRGTRLIAKFPPSRELAQTWSAQGPVRVMR
jgi:hypothetical protein